MGAADVPTDIVADHERLGGLCTKLSECGREEVSGRLAEDDGRDASSMLQGNDEWGGVQAQAVGGTPIAGHAQGDQARVRLGHQQTKGAI